MTDRIELPQEVYDALVGLWNQVYQEHELGKVLNDLYSRGYNEIQTDWILKAIPHDGLRYAMRVAYDVLHKYCRAK